MPQLSETTYEWGKRTLAEVLGAFNSMHAELLASRALLTAATERAEKAEAQRDRMREALEKYGRHGRWCRFFEDDVIDCQCGLSRVLKEVGDE